MTNLEYLTPTRRATAEIIVKTRDWLEGEEREIDAKSMAEASALFTKTGLPLSRALLYQPEYKEIWDGAESPEARRNASKRATRLAEENERLKTTIADLRADLDTAKKKAKELSDTEKRLRAELASLEAEKQDLLKGYVEA